MIKQLLIITIVSVILIEVSQAACTKTDKSPINVIEYYATAQNLRSNELHTALNTIIKGHKAFRYTPCVWQILKEADEDPLNKNSVIGFYTRRSIKKSNQVSGSGNPNDWNREHIWAKSHGFKNKNQHAHTDTHHIRATDVSVNADRGNRDFANGGISNKECTECLMKPVVADTNATWESPHRVKGDTARMMFYMAVRYDGNDNSNTPDLLLVNTITKVKQARFGKLCQLLKWHKSDPVSDKERKRNEIIYSWQGNRNPFIDHPEYADLIWSDQCNSTDSVSTEKAQILQRITNIELELQQLKNRVLKLE